MADQKLSELAELAATPAVDDELYIRDVSEAAATESKRITVANLLAKSADINHNEPERVLDVVYQNTSGKIRFVTVNVDTKAEDDIGKTQSMMKVLIGSSTPPSTLVATIGIDSLSTGDGGTLSMKVAGSFIVPPNWYYEVEKYIEGISLSLIDWHEWDFH